MAIHYRLDASSLAAAQDAQSECAIMRFQDLFHFNPPQLLSWSDWVLDFPRPELPAPTVRLSDAKQQHLNTREAQLTDFIKTRLPKTDIFYAFKHENKHRKKSRGQFVVTQLYALYEVEHWPLAKEHVQWTMFVIANLSYDEQGGSDGHVDGLVVPSLPSAAAAMYREMTIAYQAKSVRRTLKSIKPPPRSESSCGSRPMSSVPSQLCQSSLQQGQILVGSPTQDSYVGPQCRRKESVSGHEMSVATISNHKPHQTDTTARSATTEAMLQQNPRIAIVKNLRRPRAFISSPLRTEVDATENTCVTPASITPIAPVPWPQSMAETRTQALPAELQHLVACNGFYTPSFRDWISKNTEFYAWAMEGHAHWATRSVRRQHQTFVRWILSHPESQSWTAGDCFDLARDQVHRKADMAYREWRRHCPSVAFDEDYPFLNWLDKMFAYLLATVRHRDPIPADATAAFVRELNAKHKLEAAARQQEILWRWARGMSAQLEERKNTVGAIRFRLEASQGFVMDLWTGVAEEVEAFVERINARVMQRNEGIVESPHLVA